MPIDYNLLAGMGRRYNESYDSGVQAGLLQQKAARDAAFRNALALSPEQEAALAGSELGGNMLAPHVTGGSSPNYLIADFSPAQAQNLLSIDPERAVGVLQAQRQQRQEAAELRQRRASEALRYLESIEKASDKALMWKLIAESPDENNPLRGLPQILHEQGAINLDDGVSEDEVQLIIQYAKPHLSAIAAPTAQSRVQSTQVLEDGTIAYVTSDGQLVRTGEKARNPMQVTDVGGGVGAVNRLTGEVQMLSTSEAETAAAAQRAEAEKLAGTRGTTTAQRWATQIDEGFAAADSLPVLRRGLELLKDVGVETGGLDALKLWASNRLGVTGADEGELSANLGKAVLAQLRSTFGAQFTEREGARLAEIEAGFGKSTAANTRLLEQAYQIVERTARRGINAARNAGDEDSARMIEEAMSFKITYDGSAGHAAPRPAPSGWTIEEE